METSGKFILKDITHPFDTENEGTVKDARGTLIQILDGPSFAHLVYLDLLVSNPPVYRGSHYHKKKIEVFYIISGLVEAQLYDLDTRWKGTLILSPGHKLTLSTRLAHRFRALEYAQIIEVSPEPFDKDDVFPFDFSVCFKD